MNKIKPEDVIRALECCIKTQCENCCNLGSWHEQWNCMTDLMKKALALLREKDAEIERLKALNKVLKDNNHQCHRLGYEDAITEFAERLIKNCDAPHWCVWMSEIEDIANEMKEQNDEKKS